jgi:ABC-type uncharacterized transport system substrate-binding protein
MKRWAIVLGVLFAVNLFTCALVFGQQKAIQIGVLQFASHPALDGARDGFIDALT